MCHFFFTKSIRFQLSREDNIQASWSENNTHIRNPHLGQRITHLETKP